MTQEQKANDTSKTQTAIIKAVSSIIGASEKRVNDKFQKIKDDMDKVSSSNSTLEKQVKELSKQVNEANELKDKVSKIEAAMKEGKKPPVQETGDAKTVAEDTPQAAGEIAGDTYDELRMSSWAKKGKAKAGEKSKGIIAGYKAMIDEKLDRFAIKHAPKFKIARGIAGAIGAYIVAIGPVFSGIKAGFKGGSLFGTIGDEYSSLLRGVTSTISSIITDPFALAMTAAVVYAAMRVYKRMKTEYATYKSAREKGQI